MGKIIVISMITLDGVLQAPGGPKEDTSGGFKYGGWTAPYGDDKEFSQSIAADMQPADLLLGRKTFALWEDYWPQREQAWPGINGVKKYVVSGTRKHSDWQNAKFLTGLDDIKELKRTHSADLKVWGSGNLVQTLLKADLVDELHLKIYPLTLGKGKKLFAEGTIPAAFTLVDGTVTSGGIIVANYRRAGEVKTGSVEA